MTARSCLVEGCDAGKGLFSSFVFEEFFNDTAIMKGYLHLDTVHITTR